MPLFFLYLLVWQSSPSKLFLRYNVNQIPVAWPQPCSAIEVLMSRQRQLAHSLPYRKIQETKKMSFIITYLHCLKRKGFIFCVLMENLLGTTF